MNNAERQIVIKVPKRDCTQCDMRQKTLFCLLFKSPLSFEPKNYLWIKPCKECFKATAKKALPEIRNVNGRGL